MAFSPMFRTQTGPNWTPTITLDNGNPANITGATGFILYIRDPDGIVYERTGGGTVTVANGALGQIIYPWGPNDTAIVGKFTLQFQWTTATGLTQMTDQVPWEVKPI